MTPPTVEQKASQKKFESPNGPELSLYTGEEAFRDSIGTLTKDGKRRWIFPKFIDGKYFKWRNVLSVLLLIILFAGPFLSINGRPFLLLNFLERKFVIFGQAFWPQDFHLFALAMLAGLGLIFLFTVAYGRIFCGWVCPQTIFMEFVFRRIERWIEGDGPAQQALDRASWTTEKIIKKTSKHAIFYAISFLISNIFLAYIIGKDALIKIITDPLSAHVAGLGSILVFSAVFYFVFARVREQVCIAICPYGRLQGVLLDNNSIVIAYDHLRGEPRGKLRKNEVRLSGDCIDCYQCVQVCPTGIDIRNGTQLECINCTACIDACDAIMDRIEKPQGLIRYASQNQITHGEKFRFSPRLIAYSVVLAALVILEGGLIFNRSDLETTLLRVPGTLYTLQPDGTVTNLFQYHMLNKTNVAQNVELVPENSAVVLTFIGHDKSNLLELKSEELGEGTILARIPKKSLTGVKTPLVFHVKRGDEILETVKTNFIGPY